MEYEILLRLLKKGMDTDILMPCGDIISSSTLTISEKIGIIQREIFTSVLCIKCNKTFMAADCRKYDNIEKLCSPRKTC